MRIAIEATIGVFIAVVLLVALAPVTYYYVEWWRYWAPGGV